jgi:hypothetical protein
MANNYTQTSFYFRCGTAENAAKVACWINGGSEHPYPADLVKSMTESVPETFDDGCLDVTIGDATVDEDQVWVHADVAADLELLATILAYAMDTMPEVEDRQGFQWAETCDKPRVDEFGGGACFIARGQPTRWLHTGQWLAEQAEAKPSNGDRAMQIVREFVSDVMAANANDYQEASDTLDRDWPDLGITFHKAHALVSGEA